MIQTEMGYALGVAANCANLGMAYQQLARYDQVRPYWEQALQIFTQIGSPHAKTVQGWIDGLDQDDNEE